MGNSGPVTGVVLAAGRSKRLGATQPKQLLVFEGESMVRRAVRRAIASGLGQVVTVVGFEAERVTREVEDLASEVVENPSFQEGQSSSVCAGLAAVDPSAVAAMFIPCDQPHLSTEVIDSLLRAYRSTGGPIVLPTFDGRRGSPVIFDRSLFGELAAIRGDSGGRQLFPKHAEQIVSVPVADGRVLMDVDTPESWNKMR
jgi:molybdenum cofactor cytidylyltransferase